MRGATMSKDKTRGNDEQDMVEVCERIERLESERDEYRRSSNDWARHFKMERTARMSVEAEVARLRGALEKVHRKTYDVDDDLAEELWNIAGNALAEGNGNG